MRKVRGTVQIVLAVALLAVFGLSAAHAGESRSVPAVYRTGLEFNGKDAWVDLSTPFADVPNTFEFWVKVPKDISNSTRVGILIGSYVTTQEPNHATNIEIYTSGRLRAYWDVGKPNIVVSGFDARKDEWFHYAVVRDATGETGFRGFRIYVNGELVFYSSDPGATVNPRDASKIGGDYRAPGGPLFNGKIGDIRVWSKPRTQEEIKQYMYVDLTGNEEGLLGYWKMDEGQGDVLYDSSPYKNHGRIIGATWYTEGAENVDVSFGPVRPGGDGQTLGSTAVLSSERLIENAGISIQATVSELVWNQNSRAYDVVPIESSVAFSDTVTVGPNGTEVALSASVPGRPGFWQVEYRVTADDGIGVRVRNPVHKFQRYSPSAWEAGEPYTIVVFPDTQHYAATYPDILMRMAEWVAANAAERNIELVLHVGDVTNDNSPPQWERARAAIGLLDGVVPYVLSVGNHDLVTQGGGNPDRRGTSLIKEYFPPEKFPGLAGSFKEGDLANTYHTYRVGGVDYLIVSLEFCPPDEVLEWANRVVAAHPDHRAIMLTHSYTAKDGLPERTGTTVSTRLLAANPGTTVNEGEAIWEKFVKNHPNIWMTVSGHTPVSTIPRRIATGVHGNRVYEILVDYQSEPNGGNGWLAILEFQPDGNIVVSAYSPYLSEYKTTVDAYGFNNQFVIDTEEGRILPRSLR